MHSLLDYSINSEEKLKYLHKAFEKLKLQKAYIATVHLFDPLHVRLL